jgi:hypothetical protein
MAADVARLDGAGRSPAWVVGRWGVSGGGGEGDLVAELLELADEALGVGLGVGVPLEVVAPEVLVVDVVVQDVPDDHQHRVSDREDRLAFAVLAEPAAEPAELGRQVRVAGPGGAPCGFAESGAERGVAFAGLAGAALAGGLVVAGTEPGPGSQVRVPGMGVPPSVQGDRTAEPAGREGEQLSATYLGCDS